MESPIAFNYSPFAFLISGDGLEIWRVELKLVNAVWDERHKNECEEMPYYYVPSEVKSDDVLISVSS
jgi:hypothetical protein